MADEDYWTGFESEVYFDEPGDRITGVVEQRAHDQGGAGRVPRLGIRTEDGALRWVTAHQARLRAELAEQKPLIGERIFIVYVGDAPKSLSHMTPAKLFKVKIEGREKPAKAVNDQRTGAT